MPFKDPEKNKKCKQDWAESHREQTRLANKIWRLNNVEYLKDYNKNLRPSRKNTEQSRKNDSERKKKLREIKPKECSLQSIAHHHAQHIPLAKFCEVCPEDDIQLATQQHHPDYNYPEITVSCCDSCHYYLNRSTTPNEPFKKAQLPTLSEPFIMQPCKGNNLH